MTTIEDFYVKHSTDYTVPEESYKGIDCITADAEAFSRCTFKSLYIIDIYKHQFIYVSDNPLFLCGLPAEEVKEEST